MSRIVFDDKDAGRHGGQALQTVLASSAVQAPMTWADSAA